MPEKQISLFYKEGSSDKEYHVQVVQAPSTDLFLVTFQYGRRGSTLTDGCKTPSPLPLDKAIKIYEDVVKKQMAKGYTQGASGTPYVGTSKEERTTGMIPQLLNPIDESEVESLLQDPAWGAQEKMDGKHIMVKVDDDVVASNRKGLQVGIPQTVIDGLKKRFVGELDGEMIGDIYYVFDLLRAGQLDFRNSPYSSRHDGALSHVPNDKNIKVVPLYVGERAKRDLYARLRKANKEGIVFKRLDAPSKPGRPASGGSMLKHKFYATCSCLVDKGRAGKRSIALSLKQGAGWVSVGNCTIPANQPIPKVGDIVEIRYLYAYKGGSLYQPVLIGIRDDLEPNACDLKQLKYKAEED